ncbi:MAG: DUF3168 domain-containing protein [Proteobacteria bacterium]|nr:DUF3168 domain-containing protein [Pseudomonadota bacterium]
MTPELVFQKALRTRLTESAALTALVPGSSILDRNERPTPDPSIIIGEGQAVDEGDSLARNRYRIYLDLHVWKKEASLEGVKLIAGLIRQAVKSGRIFLDAPFHCADCRVSSTRFMRDPDGQTSHAVVAISALVSEVE